MTDKTAIIIGASSGIGLALASELAGRGWLVTATTRREAPELAEASAESGGRITLATVDIDTVDSIKALDTALGTKKFDLIFVNAGTIGPMHGSVDRVTTAEIGALMMTNAIAPVRLAKLLLPRAVAGGTVVLMTSILGSVTLNVNGTFDLYRASKAALNSLSRGFYAHDVAPLGLTLLNLHPGWVKTRMGGPGAAIEIADSVRGIANVVEANHGGGQHYIDFEGNTLPW
ncbi:MAG: SDR family NAD(P)-dependent oxidoreductase [Sandarakinorhabdus sp.]|nr:SDR family NAD(P)-dependent oxidoreductase [Sandarakinorhabdus sp.]